MYYLNVSFIILKLMYIIQYRIYFVKLIIGSYLRLHAIRSDYKRKSGLFNIGFGLFIYILIPFLLFSKNF